MYIEESLRNVRCDTVACHRFAKFNISTNSYKGKLCLCDKCFNDLFTSMSSINKTENKPKGENNAKRK